MTSASRSVSVPRTCAFAALLAAILVEPAAAADNIRFSGRLRNGERIEAGELRDWHDEKAQPSLEGRKLFDEGNPFRWLVDAEAPPPPTPPAYVEFVGGDRLPGRVVGAGSDSAFERSAPHLLVEPAVQLDDPGANRSTRVRVETRSLRRVVWQADHERPLRPGTVFHEDGRETTFRTLRWTESSLLALTSTGLETIPIGSVAEVHLAAGDDWDAYLDDLARLAPGAEGTLMRWETRDGLVVTSSTRRFQPMHRGDRKKHSSWVHLVQPTWSLDPFWVRFDTVRSLQFWKPTEIPLSRIRPSEVRRESVFGSAWGWRADRSSQGSALRSGPGVHGWGFGVHARTELHFDMPDYAKSIRSEIGLDSSVGSGGCARAEVFLGSDLARRLYESPLLIGSSETRDTGDRSIPSSKDGPTRLVLVADMARGEEPAGGDPFDVRDTCDWLDPLVTLDPAAVLDATRQRSAGSIASLDGWRPGNEAGVVLGSVWDRSDPRDPRYITSATVDGPYHSWTRVVRPGSDDRWMAIAVHRRGDDDDPGTTVQVRMNGSTVGEFDVPRWSDEWGPNPVLVPLDPIHRSREVEIQLVVVPDVPGESAVVWKGIDFVEHPPHLLAVFDEDLRFPRDLRDGDGTATVTLEDAARGEASLVVTPGSRGSSELPDLSAQVSERPRVGEYRYLRFAWRKDGGKQIGLQVAHDGRLGVDDELVRPRIVREHARSFQSRRHTSRDRRGVEVGYQYDSSFGKPDGGAALRLDKKPPESWRVVTRDLFADFGEFRVTGFSFVASDGKAAYFDTIYLARKGSDFTELDRRTSEPPLADGVLARKVDPWGYSQILESFAQGFTSGEIGEGAVLLDEYRGRRNVLRTMGPDHNRPCVLRKAFVVPAGSKTRLVADVACDENEEWKLEVVVNGERRLSEVVGRQTPKDENGWSKFEVDLTRHAGEPVVLDVLNRRHNDRRGSGYFSRIQIVSE